MNQNTQTPRTDACESTPDRGGIRARTWKVTRLVDTSRSLERENAELRAALRALTTLAANVCSATDGIGVINSVAELRPQIPEARAALAKVTP